VDRSCRRSRYTVDTQVAGRSSATVAGRSSSAPWAPEMAVRSGARLALVLGTAVVVFAGAGVLLANLGGSPGAVTPAGGPVSGSVAGPPSGGVAPAGTVSPAAATPVPGTSGDRYVRNVMPGATCSAVGSIGFTAKAQVMRCATTAADPHPRWRTS